LSIIEKCYEIEWIIGNNRAFLHTILWWCHSWQYFLSSDIQTKHALDLDFGSCYPPLHWKNIALFFIASNRALNFLDTI